MIKKLLRLLKPRPPPIAPYPGWRMRWMFHGHGADWSLTVWWLMRPDGRMHGVLTQHIGLGRPLQRLYPSGAWFHQLRN